MQTSVNGVYDKLWESLISNLALDLFEEEEIEEVLHTIKGLDAAFRQKSLALCAALSQSASGLVPSILRRIKAASRHLNPPEMEGWVTRAFDIYESKGMDAFFQFLSKTDEEDLSQFKALNGLHLNTVISLLETYLRGISGLPLKIAPDDAPYTDTDTVFLPSIMNVYDDAERNFLLYKLMAVHQWAQISLGTLTPSEDTLASFIDNQTGERLDIQQLFIRLPDQGLAIDLYNLLDAFRRDDFLKRELPGLMRSAEVVKRDISLNRPRVAAIADKISFMEGLYQYYLTGRSETPDGEPFGRIASLVESIGTADERERIRLFLELHDYVSGLEGSYHQRHFLFLGSLNPDAVSRYLRARKSERKNRLETVITKLVDMPEVEIHALLRNVTGESLTSDQKPGQEAVFFQIKGKVFQLDKEAAELIRETAIFSDGILLDGSSVSDAKTALSIQHLLNSGEHDDVQGGIQYDEWDFRRSDYKRGWCHLFEQDIPEGDEPFVEMTLRRYGGYVKTLRRKFELLKRELKLLRRQKEGDDVDIDAIIEAFADTRAGLSPSQDLFVKLDRRARSIAALFLLDMSGSTKGWINRAEKESLVLMCEALEALGDQYSIYGFSGIARTKNDFYRIKNFCEPYATEVKKRIAGIAPQDYTRMGPAIRHATGILNAVDARTKLLITLSDGHPEDRDGYRGDYGIEDTRKALIEAKQEGIQPFCITIDREASSYLPHMFGEVSYVVLDDVRKLPNKITEIYRKLTT